MSDHEKTARELAAWDCPGECVAECAHSGLMCPKHRDAILAALTAARRQAFEECERIAREQEDGPDTSIASDVARIIADAIAARGKATP